MSSNPQRVAYSAFNGYAPKEGPKALPIEFDFSTVALLEINLYSENATGIIQFVQSVWVENQDNANDLVLTVQATGQIIHVPAGAQGMWPVIAIDQTIITLSGTVGANTGKIILLNVPMSYFNSGGTQDISGSITATLTAASLDIYRGSYTDFSGTITTGGVSQQAIATNTARKGLLIQNPVTAVEPLWVNFGGGAGTTNGSISLDAGQIFMTNSYIPTSSIHVFAATTGHVFTAKELA